MIGLFLNRSYFHHITPGMWNRGTSPLGYLPSGAPAAPFGVSGTVVGEMLYEQLPRDLSAAGLSYPGKLCKFVSRETLGQLMLRVAKASTTLSLRFLFFDDLPDQPLWKPQSIFDGCGVGDVEHAATLHVADDPAAQTHRLACLE